MRYGIRRSFFQFRLITLLLLPVIVAAPCLWLAGALRTKERERRAVAALMRIKERERRAVAALSEHGYGVIYASEIAPRRKLHSPPRLETPIPGADLFDVVVGATFLRPTSRSRLPTNLLRAFGNLRTLSVIGSRVTDDDLKALGVVEGLEWINLCNTPITDDGLVNLGQLSRLRFIDASNTKVTGATAGELARLEGLTDLLLYDCPICDDGAVAIGRLRQLRNLALAGTQVSDKGLCELAQLGNLEALNLRLTRVSSAGVKRLRRALPNCSIEFSGQ